MAKTEFIQYVSPCFELIVSVEDQVEKVVYF